MAAFCTEHEGLGARERYRGKAVHGTCMNGSARIRHRTEDGDKPQMLRTNHRAKGHEERVQDNGYEEWEWCIRGWNGVTSTIGLISPWERCFHSVISVSDIGEGRCRL